MITVATTYVSVRCAPYLARGESVVSYYGVGGSTPLLAGLGTAVLCTSENPGALPSRDALPHTFVLSGYV